MAIEKYTISRHGWIFKSYKIHREKKQILKVKSTGFLKQFVISDMNDQEVMRIKRPMSFFKMKFELIVNDEVRAEIYRDTTLFENNLTIDTAFGLYFVEGNFWANEFTIENDKVGIAMVSRQKFSKDKYGLAILEGEDSLFIIGIVMAIEMMIRVRNARKKG